MIARIHGRQPFASLARDGRRIRRQSLWCSWCPEPHSEVTRVGYAIGRAFGPAVRRNRMRRRIREIVRLLDHDRPLPPGILVIGAKPTASELTFGQLQAELATMLESVRTESVPR